MYGWTTLCKVLYLVTETSCRFREGLMFCQRPLHQHFSMKIRKSYRKFYAF